MNLELRKTAARAGLAATGSAAITGGLAFMMISMIAVTYEMVPKAEAYTFDINPEVIDIPPPTTLTPLRDYVRVEVPPPPPSPEHIEASLPDEPIVPAELPLDPFDPFEIMSGTPEPVVVDTDEMPIFRNPPIMPPRAEKSGHCMMKFDVSGQGTPFNIEAVSCSESLFARASVRAVQKWKYRAKMVEGLPVTRNGLTTRISFKLTDERGNVIPE